MLESNATQTHNHSHGDEEQPVRLVVPGIQNLGNTCFFNAILQALASLDCFREYLTHVVSKQRERNRRAPFTKALVDCIIDLAPVGEHEKHSTVVPKALNQELVTKLTAFRGNKQQDSQELLQFLINLVNDEQTQSGLQDLGLRDLFSTMGFGSVSDESNGTINGGDLSFTGSIRDSCFEEAMEERTWNPLYGLQGDLLRCDGCKLLRPLTNRRFLDVSLSFGEHAASKKPVTLWDCLRLYTAPEEISGVECNYCTAQNELKMKKTECDALQRQLDANPSGCDMETELNLYQLKEDIFALETLMEHDIDKLFQEEIAGSRCRALRNCQKWLQFSRCPDVFCFHFNRKVFHAYSGSTRKLDTHVMFPVELDMSPFCQYKQPANNHDDGDMTINGKGPHHFHPAKYGSAASSAGGDRSLVYELMAVILHHGNERCGHFTAFRRVRRSTQWFFLSDDKVREATEDEVLGSCAYMLFYERKRKLRSKGSASNGKSNTNGYHYVNGVHHKAQDSGEDEDDDENEAALARVPDESAHQFRR